MNQSAADGMFTLKPRSSDVITGLTDVPKDVRTLCKLSNTSPAFLLDLVYSILNYEFIAPLILGLPGNVMIVIIARRKHNRHVSASVYMSSMAVVDAALLLMSAIFWPILYGTDLIQQERENFFLYVCHCHIV
jgi:hypothetical protein